MRSRWELIPVFQGPTSLKSSPWYVTSRVLFHKIKATILCKNKASHIRGNIYGVWSSEVSIQLQFVLCQLKR